MVTFISALELSFLTWLRFYLLNCYTCILQLKFIYSSQKKTHYEQLQNIFINYNHTHIKFHELHISSISAGAARLHQSAFQSESTFNFSIQFIPFRRRECGGKCNKLCRAAAHAQAKQ